MILRANHELFRLHYGDFEYQRLRPIFETEPEPLTTGETWDIPKLVEASYKIRLMCVAGVGSIKFLQRLLQDKVVCEQVKALIFVENDPKVISHLINHQHFAAFIQHANIKICFGMNEESIKPNLFRILKQPNYSEIMDLGCVYFNKTESDEKSKGFYANIDSYLRETVEHVYNNYGRINDSLDGLRAVFMNGERIFNCPGIEDLKDLYVDKPAVICGAGPSLDLAIPHLLAHPNKYVIIAADAAVKPLMAAGITPQFCTSIERLNEYQKPFWENLDTKGCQLVCFPVVHPGVLDLYKGQIRFVYRNYSYFAYFQKSWPKGLLHCGGSTTNLAIRLSQYLGCSKIILAGVDHAYEEKEGGLFRSHCSNTGDPVWGEWHPIEHFQDPKGRNHAPSFDRPGNSGKPVMTNYTYYLWSKEFSEELRSLKIPIIDTAANGVTMDGIPYRPLKEVLEELPVIDIPETPNTRTLFYRKWDHKMLLQSFKGWIHLCKEGIEVMEDPELSEKHFRYIGDLYNIKIVQEDLFVSFVIQNCAVEYYKLQNEYNALDQNEGAMKAHVSIMKRRFELFIRVLEPLALMIEEYGTLKGAA